MAFARPAAAEARFRVTDVRLADPVSVDVKEVLGKLPRGDRPKKLAAAEARAILLAVTLEMLPAYQPSGAAANIQLEKVPLRDLVIAWQAAGREETAWAVGMRIPFEPNDLWTFGSEPATLSIKPSTWQFLYVLPKNVESVRFLHRTGKDQLTPVKEDLRVVP